MRVLVTGVTGQLGCDVVKQLKAKGYADVCGAGRQDFDLTNQQQTTQFILNYKPDVIIHCAAWTAVDKAEDFKQDCYNVNVLGTRYVSQAAQKLDAKLVYISTDYVFNGQGTNFFEVGDAPSPLSTYGQTKYLGELEAMKCKKHFVVRVSWVFGLNGNNFVKTMLKLAQTKTEINVVDDQIGSPTYTVDLAKLIVAMVETNKFGVYHATNQGECSWCDFAKEIFRLANINIKVNPITTKEYPTKAVRPLNSRLSKQSLIDAGFKLLPSWQNALKRYIAELKNEFKREI